MTQTLTAEPCRDNLRSLVFALLALLLVTFLILFGLWQAHRVRAKELIHFNHEAHLAAGVECTYCHPGVINGAVAGLPSVRKCMGCHENVQVQTESGQYDVERLTKAWAEGQSLLWIKDHDQPDFVRFSHQPHVVSGVACESCHGNVREMEVLEPAYRINMGFCLGCHREQPEEKTI